MSRYIYGKNPVLEHLRTGDAPKRILIAEGVHGAVIKEIEQLAATQAIPLERVPKSLLTQNLRHSNHQGIIAEVKEPGYSSLEEILAVAKQRREPPLIALLDGVQDPHNLGAIIRSADGAGIHGIIIPKDRSAGLSPTVEKSSAGAAAHVRVAQITNLARAIDELKEAGLWIFGTDQNADQTLYEADFSGAVGIVLGSEGKGMRQLIRKKCDFLVRVPMHGKLASLNVSVTAALLFYEIRKTRK